MRALNLTFAAAMILGSALSCGAGDAATPTSGKGRVVDSSSGTVALGLDDRKAYHPAAAGTGAIEGRIAPQAAPADSVVAVTRDQRVCGDSASVTDAGAGSLANTLVWVDGITAGKPLPEVRRETLTIERCQFEPRVIAVVAGSTINVFSRDKAVHDIRFYREGAGEPVGWVHTVDEGEVVPADKIAATPGIVEARCSMHPWARGYIAVFDHPYFAVTDDQGAFKIDGLPAGTYGVKVWHQGMDRPAEQRVVVSNGGVGRLDLTVALK